MVDRMTNTRIIFLCVIALSVNRPSIAEETLVLPDAALPSLSPLGSEFVCDSEAGILRVSVDGIIVDTLALETTSQEVGTPLWHPDGQSVIYIRRDTNPVVSDWQIVIHKLTGTITTTWPSPGLWDDFGISFYADSSEVLFDDANTHVWALNIKTGVIRTFLVGLDASTSPDGRQIVYLDNSEDNNILVTPITGGPSVNIGKGTFPLWTADGGYIIFTDDAGDLIISSREGTYTAPFLTDTEYDIAGSHCGDVLAFTRCGSGSCSVWMTKLSLVPVKPITWGNMKAKLR
jgi:Tol biopolymer transport system component